jgi:hypothetical protein
MSDMSMRKVLSADESVIYRRKSGRYCLLDIMKASLTGTGLKPFKRASDPTFTLSSTRQVAP